jgi:mitofusin 1
MTMIGKEALLQVLRSDTLIDVMERRCDWAGGEGGEDGGGLRTQYKGFARQLEADRFVIPMTGVQGSGKSTFLNALLFRQPVLPIDVDETTCVPVEIRYSASPGAQAVVRYMDGREERIQAVEEDLERYVHQAHNPANRKGVERVLLESDALILKNGVVIVDLPGLGSLTNENIQTTQEYLNEAVGVLFLLRTVPPLTGSESIFVAGIWARLRVAHFLQNQWTDETAQEAEDAQDFNVGVLKQIARTHHIKLDADPKVWIVNAYRALEAALKGDEEKRGATGIDAFSASFRDVAARWPGQVLCSILGAVRSNIVLALETIRSQVEGLAKEEATIREEIADEEKRFDEYLADIVGRRDTSIGDVRAATEESHQFISRWNNEAGGELRNRMRTKLRAGIVDGPRLKRALLDEQKEFFDDLYATLQANILNLTDRLRTRYEDVPEWSHARREAFRTVSAEEKTKWESLLPTLGGIGTGLGGMWGGAKLGALAGSWAGPAGAIIGGLVGGLLGSLFGSWAGERSRQYMTEQRAQEIEPQVFQAIDGFIGDSEQNARAVVNDVKDKLESFLDGWVEEQTGVYQKERSRRQATLTMTAEEKAAETEALRKDAHFLSNTMARIEGNEE